MDKKITGAEAQEVQRILGVLGGNKGAATAFGITSAAISQWRQNGIPKAQIKYLRLARPDIFAAPELAAPTPATTDKSAVGEGV